MSGPGSSRRTPVGFVGTQRGEAREVARIGAQGSRHPGRPGQGGLRAACATDGRPGRGAPARERRGACARLPGRMRICVVYDCLFPYTIGGAERWYRNLAQRLAADGHEVTYLTLRQWPAGERGEVPGVRVVAAGPRMSLYRGAGQRRILPPLVFGAGVLWHLLRHGRRYDVVHTCSFPYFSLLAVALARPLGGFRLVVDWFELWSDSYWREYLGGAQGRVGAFVQGRCLKVRQQAFAFAELTA